MKREQFLKALTRFWANVQRSPEGCWLWMGQVNNHGYGVLCIWAGEHRQRLLAHRVSIVLASGVDIDGRVVMHTCDNPPCVNPEHLKVGGQIDNMRDALQKGRLNLDGLALGQAMRQVGNSKKTACKHGHEYTPENTYRDPKGHRRCRECHHLRQKKATADRREQRIRAEVA